MESTQVSQSILDIFDESRRLLGISWRPELRMSDELGDSAGIARRGDTPGEDVILLDAHVEEYLEEGGIRYLIGHELGHLMRIGRYFPRGFFGRARPKGKIDPFPNVLARMTFHLIGEMAADLHGVKACGSTDVAAQAVETFMGSPGLKRRFYDADTDYNEIDSQVIHWFSAVEMASLRNLRDSVLLSDILSAESFDYGKDLMSYSEFWEFLFARLFSEEYGLRHDTAVSDCLMASLWILRDGQPARQTEGKKYMSGIEHQLGFHRRPFNSSYFSSKNDAFRELYDASARIYDYRHPIKNIAFESIAVETSRLEEDKDSAAEFIYDVGTQMGFSTEDVLWPITYYC